MLQPLGGAEKAISKLCLAPASSENRRKQDQLFAALFAPSVLQAASSPLYFRGQASRQAPINTDQWSRFTRDILRTHTSARGAQFALRRALRGDPFKKAKPPCMARQNFTARRGSRHDIGTKSEKRARIRRPQPSSRATYADLLTIGALFLG